QFQELKLFSEFLYPDPRNLANTPKHNPVPQCTSLELIVYMNIRQGNIIYITCFFVNINRDKWYIIGHCHFLAVISNPSGFWIFTVYPCGSSSEYSNRLPDLSHCRLIFS